MATSQHRKVRLTTEEFVARARAVHGDAYDYSKVVYTFFRLSCGVQLWLRESDVEIAS